MISSTTTPAEVSYAHQHSSAFPPPTPLAGNFPSNYQSGGDYYRDDALANQLRQKTLISQLNNYLSDNAEREASNPMPPVKSHRLQIRDGTLKFRLNDGNLRIGRGFGKRSFSADPYAEK